MTRAPTKSLPSQKELLRLLSYDPETGVLTWRINQGSCAAGKIAGTVGQRSGYLAIGIKRRYYGAHRLIWKIMTGEDPIAQIDHINGIRTDNRWANIRAADNRKNTWNSGIKKNNTSGFKGVQYKAKQPRRPWIAVLVTNAPKSIKLGSFATREEAAAAWQAAAEKQRGEFMRQV